MVYVVTINQPGYLPETGPAEFDELTDARQYIAAEIELDWDHAYESAAGEFKGEDLDDEQVRIDGLYLEAHTGSQRLNSGWHVTANGYVYEITEC